MGGRAEEPRTVAPGTAAKDAATAITTSPSRAIRGRAVVCESYLRSHQAKGEDDDAAEQALHRAKPAQAKGEDDAAETRCIVPWTSSRVRPRSKTGSLLSVAQWA